MWTFGVTLLKPTQRSQPCPCDGAECKRLEVQAACGVLSALIHLTAGFRSLKGLKENPRKSLIEESHEEPDVVCCAAARGSLQGLQKGTGKSLTTS